MRKLMFAVSVAALLLIGCSSNSKKNEEQTAQEKESIKQEKVINVEPKPTIKPKEEEKSLSDKTKEMAASATEVVKKSAKDATKKIGELASQAKDSELVQKALKQAHKSIKVLSNLAPTSGTVTQNTKGSANANELFSKCAGCHGNKAQNKALGVSKVIAGWDAKKIENALQGYKDGTYGGSMKSIMKTQVNSLSDDDLKSLAKYISKL